MKLLFLSLCLALPAAQARAQDGAAQRGRDALLADIASWRGSQLVHVDPPEPLTAEFEPRLDEIEAKVKAAQSADDLTQPKKDFEAWQHDLLLKKYGATKRVGLTSVSLNRYSRAERARIGTVAAAADRISQDRIELTSAQLFDGGGGDADAVAAYPGGPASSPASAGLAPAHAPGLHIAPTPPPPPTAKPLSLASLRDYFDRSGISDAVVKSVEKIKNEVAGFGHLLSGFAGSCYYGVKWMLIKTHVLPPEVSAPEEIGKIGIGAGNAYEMSAALKHNPKLQARLRVRPLDLTTVKDSDAALIPERTMFVFDRGCAGFSSESGHIEYTLLSDKIKDLPASAFYRVGRRRGLYKPTIASNEVLACSDGCMVHTMAYLRTYGRKRCLSAYVPVTDAAAAP